MCNSCQVAWLALACFGLPGEEVGRVAWLASGGGGGEGAGQEGAPEGVSEVGVGPAVVLRQVVRDSP